MNALSEDYLAHFAEAIVSEIKAEMGRKNVDSLRALSRLLGHESPQYISSRLGGGHPKTGQRVVLNVKDLAAIGAVLEVDPSDFIQRAQLAVIAGDELAKRRKKASAPAPVKRAARKSTKPKKP